MNRNRLVSRLNNLIILLIIFSIACAYFCIITLEERVTTLESNYHALNKRILIIEHPDLVRPFDREAWESRKSGQ